MLMKHLRSITLYSCRVQNLHVQHTAADSRQETNAITLHEQIITPTPLYFNSGATRSSSNHPAHSKTAERLRLYSSIVTKPSLNNRFSSCSLRTVPCTSKVAIPSTSKDSCTTMHASASGVCCCTGSLVADGALAGTCC